jgi:hypothetical protein
MEEFTLGIFANCDKADRESPIQPPEQSLAGRFYISSLFFDVLTQFYPDRVLPPDLEEKRRYAKYRTIQIKNGKPMDPQPESTANSLNQQTEPVQIMNVSQASQASSKPAVQNASGFKYAESSGDDTPSPPSPKKEPKPPIKLTTPVPPLPEKEDAEIEQSISRGGAMSAKKKLQQAISAIDFADYVTAGKLCLEALAMLGHRQ